MMNKLLTKSKYTDQQGREIWLGKKIGEGGEGVVYEIRNRPTEVFKLYHQASKEQEAKLQVMLELRTNRLEQYTAWIKDLVYQEGRMVGYTQPYLVGYRPIHLLYTPKSRASAFPKAGVRFLLHTAANIARAFCAVHTVGQVVGDINHSNLFVSDLGLVRLIDCDSFQIRQGEKSFACGVGVPTFQAPEWQAKQVTERTEQQDAFGLAVLLFHLLYLGRHPFAGIGDSAERSIEKAIGERDFLYSKHNLHQKRKLPPGMIPFSLYPKEIQVLFERAFLSLEPSERPTARQWVQVLANAIEKMKSCEDHSKHMYASYYQDCPWCRVEARCGITFFPHSVDARQKVLQSPEEIWAPVTKTALPFSKLPSPKEIQVRPSPTIRHYVQKRRGWRNLRIGVAVLLAVVSLWWQSLLFYGIPVSLLLALLDWKPRRKLKHLHQIYQLAEQDWNMEVKKFQRDLERSGHRRHLQQWQRLQREYQLIERLKQQKWSSVRRSKIRALRAKYLQQFPLCSAKLSLLTESRLALLEQRGIRTAADIRPAALQSISELGVATMEQLLQWRKKLAKEYIPAQIEIPEEVKQQIQREVEWKHRLWQRKAILARNQYLQWQKSIRQASDQQLPSLEEKARRLAQAHRDYLFLLTKS